MTYKKSEQGTETHEPEHLEDLIKEMEAHSERYDFSDDYLVENGHPLSHIGEYMYGVSMTPTAWVLPYLLELQKLKKEGQKE